ncbi:MAG: hypothetical protein ACXWG1_00765 [Usitatibacter sp.]
MKLKAIKVAHTVVWAFFAACVLIIWWFAWRGELGHAAVAIGVVSGEVAILAANGWKCPLTAVAARYTSERRDNFDIYLPEWLARENKRIFGTLYVLGALFTLARWIYASS